MVKAKYGLNDKSEALNKFAHLYGTELLEPEVSDEYVKKILEIDEQYLKKKSKRRMTLEDLDELCGLS